MSEQKPAFLNSQSTSSGTQKGGDSFESPAQKSGGMEPDGGNDKFPNRPQKSGGASSDANPQSKTPGGCLPYKGAPAAPAKPFKLG